MAHRRYFFQTLAAGAAAARYAFPANDTVRVGCIGAGGRAQVLMRTFESLKGAQLAAVCDVWDQNLQRARQIAGPAAFAAKDYRALLDRKDLDAVLIGAPDHQHAPLTVAACEAGKDVYVEKPLTHDLTEGAAVLEAQKRTGRVVQVGLQQRSMPHMQKAFEIVRSGQLGKIHKAHLTWNRNHDRWEKPPATVDPASVDWKAWLGAARQQPFDEYRFRQWRWFWDFGGGIFTDLMVHHIDIVQWMLDLGDPASATSIGDHFATKGLWETPDTVQTLIRYPERELQVYFEGTFVNARNAEMIELMGTDGTLYLDRGRYELHPEPKRATYNAPARAPKFPYSEWILGAGPKGADFYENPNGELLHLTNWMECIRSRKTPAAPVEAGVRSAAAAHLANRALRGGEVARWA
ncbi:MAG TPA: gfo/Idh/MocA family oxidoreductase [Solibacterales bacterium]|nr:gfo/Idh/MocA family oxidoreductase [Bryobacterales bacterium]